MNDSTPSRDGLRAIPVSVEPGETSLAALTRAFPARGEEIVAAFARGDVVDAFGAPLAPESIARAPRADESHAQQTGESHTSKTDEPGGCTTDELGCRTTDELGCRATDEPHSSQANEPRSDGFDEPPYIYVFRPIPDEPAEPIVPVILAQTQRWIAIDKPAGMATMPRGSHVASTATIAIRRFLGNPEAVAAHRLDAATRGVLLLTLGQQWRGAYQTMFERREVSKTYLAVAPVRDQLKQERVHRLHLVKPCDSLQTLVGDGAPNSATRIRLLEERDGRGLYEIEPLTGRTHQIRATMAHLGAPIEGDWLYPELSDDDPGVLQLLAARLAFRDPVTGEAVVVESRQRLAW